LPFSQLQKVRNRKHLWISNLQAMNSVYAERFSTPYPARTTVGVAELPLGALVEIEFIAQNH
jgi:2-iminobutanoate/2-iminopropanoate deaminase